jgi:hypothetical protein
MSWHKKKARPSAQVCAAVFGASLLLLAPSSIYGQSTRPPGTPQDPQPPNTEKPDRSGPDFGSSENEMRARLILNREKKEYDENLARAKEASQIASQLRESFEARKLFNSEESKKLERLEKLTRRIRNEAGGSETDDDVKDLPSAIEAAVKRLAEAAEDLRKEVEKTPRHVVSAAVIDQANKLIGLIQHLRNQGR